jgi:hypothetical protein
MGGKTAKTEWLIEACGGESARFSHSGVQFDSQKLQAGSVLAIDIAAHLAKTPMYFGAPQGCYTAAQHSFLLAGEAAREIPAPVPGEPAIYALLHEAWRAFTLNPRRAASVSAVIHRAFGLAWPAPEPYRPWLQALHNNVALSELRQLCIGAEREIADLERRGAVALRQRILPFGWDRANDRYLEAIRAYGRLALPAHLHAMKGVL